MPWIDSATIEDPRVQPLCNLCWTPIGGLEGEMCERCQAGVNWYEECLPDETIDLQAEGLCLSCLDDLDDPESALCERCRAEGS